MQTTNEAPRVRPGNGLSTEAAARIARQIAENSGIVTDLAGVKGAPR